MPPKHSRKPPPRPAHQVSRRGLARAWWLRLIFLGVAGRLGGGWLLPPEPGTFTLDERLAQFPCTDLPLHAAAEVRWNEWGLPFILAEDERDVPFLIGLVHGHLRRTQIEIYRRIAHGQLSELGGPLATDVDRLLRTLDLDRAVPEMARNLPADTRAWLESYVQGLNLQAQRTERRPTDALWLGLETVQVWNVEDVLAVARLASADISLSKTLGQLGLAGEPRADEFAARLQDLGRLGAASFGPEQPLPLQLLSQFSKSGSNCFVVAGSRSASGAPIFANDPHLGFNLPNFWCLLGYQTPEHTVVGLTVPGVPAVVVGRNQQIAFGGTNMAAYSTALYDVSKLPAESFTQRSEKLGTRLWFDRSVEITETPQGPLISDLALLKDLNLPPLALHWRGHDPSDEVSAFLRGSHARNWSEYRNAFQGYAIAGQNLLFASADGHIGQLLALDQVPAAALTGAQGPLDPTDPESAWGAGRGSLELPAAYDPPEGFLVSANNTPVRTDPPIVANPNNNDRVLRITELIRSSSPFSLADAAAIQRDVYLQSGQRAARAMLAVLEAPAEPADSAGAERSSPRPSAALASAAQELRARIAAWDGEFRADSQGALAYMRWLDAQLESYYQAEWGQKIAASLRGSPLVHAFIEQDLVAGRLRRQDVQQALELAARGHDQRTWGDIHRLPIGHPLSEIPWLGGLWRESNRATSGSAGTVKKSAGPLTAARHEAFFGAQTRFLSDLGDLDANFFVQLGGSDGFTGSVNTIDQVELFEADKMIQMPLRRESIQRLFQRVSRLTGQQLE